MQLAGCNRSIARPITLVRAYGKSFVSLLLAPLVIALSVDARLAPAACIIKLPACRNADEAYLRAHTHTHEKERERETRVYTPSRFTDTRTQSRAEFPLATRPLYSTLLASTCLFVAVHAARQTRRRTPTPSYTTYTRTYARTSYSSRSLSLSLCSSVFVH